MTVAGLSVIVPTFNEADNVAELVDRIDAVFRGDAHLQGVSAEVIFIDDSTDDTPAEIARAARQASIPVCCVHREIATAGLGGAVLEGVRLAQFDACLVMDGDLQHPPEIIGDMFARFRRGDVDLVVASRYLAGGTSRGLANGLRRGVSAASTAVVKAMFPLRLRDCTDPMTGFFLFDRAAIDVDMLKPQGFKILLEILARTPLRISEIPFAFADRRSGRSKATIRQGLNFLRQLVTLRFGRMSTFALIGAIGALVNISLVWALTAAGIGVFWATFTAAELTIVGNFLLIDRFVFGDLRPLARTFWARFLRSFAFNNIEALVRIALVILFVRLGWLGPTAATALLLALAFILRYVFHALVVYAPKRTGEQAVGHRNATGRYRS